MLLKRWGHLSVYLNGLIYCLGGFSHKDLRGEEPVTLDACEKFTASTTESWNYVSSMNQPRAFAS